MSYRPEVVDHHVLIMYAASLIRGCSSPFELYDPAAEACFVSSTSKNFNPSSGPPSHRSNINPAPHRSDQSLDHKTVLDIGCGPSASWCVGVLRSHVRVDVVGLDICPILLDLAQFEPAVSDHLTFVQADFLSKRLPFENDSFDYVHASFISPGVPETHWARLIEEMTRILKPGCPLELSDYNLVIVDPVFSDSSNLHHDHPPLHPFWPSHPPNDLSTQVSMAHPSFERETAKLQSNNNSDHPQLSSVRQMIEQLLDRHFISPFPLSIIPAQLSMCSTGMKRPLLNKAINLPGPKVTTPKSATSIRSHPHSVSSSTDPSHLVLRDESIGKVLLQSLVNALAANREIVWEESWLPLFQSELKLGLNDESSSLAKSNGNPRTWSDRKVGFPSHQSNMFKSSSPSSSDHNDNTGGSDGKLESISARLERMGGSSTTTAEGAGDRSHHPRRQATVCSRAEFQSQRKKFESVWSNWKESVELSHHSTNEISKLLETRFGWTCKMDHQHHQVLDQQYKCYQSQLELCEIQLSQYFSSNQEAIYSRNHRNSSSFQAEQIGVVKDGKDEKGIGYKMAREALLSQRSELKKMMQLIQTDLINVKRRLGLVEDIHLGRAKMHKERRAGGGNIIEEEYVTSPASLSSTANDTQQHSGLDRVMNSQNSNRIGNEKVGIDTDLMSRGTAASANLRKGCEADCRGRVGTSGEYDDQDSEMGLEDEKSLGKLNVEVFLACKP